MRDWYRPQCLTVARPAIPSFSCPSLPAFPPCQQPSPTRQKLPAETPKIASLHPPHSPCPHTESSTEPPSLQDHAEAWSWGPADVSQCVWVYICLQPFRTFCNPPPPPFFSILFYLQRVQFPDIVSSITLLSNVPALSSTPPPTPSRHPERCCFLGAAWQQ